MSAEKIKALQALLEETDKELTVSNKHVEALQEEIDANWPVWGYSVGTTISITLKGYYV